MSETITLEELLELVTVKKDCGGDWCITFINGSVHGNINGNVEGSVFGFVDGNVYGHIGGYVDDDVRGYVGGDVGGNVFGNVDGVVCGTINGRKWQSVETPKDKLKRLIEEGADQEQLLEAFNQLEDN